MVAAGDMDALILSEFCLPVQLAAGDTVLRRFDKENMTSHLDYFIYVCKSVCSKSADSPKHEKLPTFKDFQEMKSYQSTFVSILDEKKGLWEVPLKRLRRELEKQLNLDDGCLDVWKTEIKEWYRSWVQGKFVSIFEALRDEKVLSEMTRKSLRQELEKRLSLGEGSLDDWKEEIKEWYGSWSEGGETTKGKDQLEGAGEETDAATTKNQEIQRISKWADRIIANEDRERDIAGVKGSWSSGNSTNSSLHPNEGHICWHLDENMCYTSQVSVVSVKRNINDVS